MCVNKDANTDIVANNLLCCTHYPSMNLFPKKKELIFPKRRSVLRHGSHQNDTSRIARISRQHIGN